MEAKDLMIGDLVNLSPGKANIPNYVMIHAIKYDNHVSKDYVFDIVFLSTGLVQYNYPIRSLKPIPLTAEILEKNGFRKGCYVGGYHSPDCPFRVFTKTGGTCGFTTLFDDEIHFSCIFVHQLQHALRLCGIEKEIEL